MLTRLIIYGVFFLALLGAVGTAKYLYDANQTLKSEKAILEARNAEVVKEGNRYANRPRTVPDRIDRVCKWARYVEERNKGKPKRGVPVRPCP